MAKPVYTKKLLLQELGRCYGVIQDACDPVCDEVVGFVMVITAFTFDSDSQSVITILCPCLSLKKLNNSAKTTILIFHLKQF